MKLKKEDILAELHTFPILPLRDIVVFPHMVVPLFVGRKSSTLALEEGHIQVLLVISALLMQQRLQPINMAQDVLVVVS